MKLCAVLLLLVAGSGELCSVSLLVGDTLVSFHSSGLPHFQQEVLSFCQENNLSKQACTSLGQHYSAKCFSTCGVQQSAQSKYGSVFFSSDKQDSESLFQELYTFCHLTAQYPKNCMKQVGESFMSSCRVFDSDDKLFSDDLYTLYGLHKPSWQLLNEKNKTEMKIFLKEALIEEYVESVEDITNLSMSKWNKHLGSYLSFHPRNVSNGGSSRSESSSLLSGNDSRDTSSGINSLPPDILPDYDADIPNYFNFLHYWCSKTSHADWYSNCYSFLLSLTSVPRCTTSMDSAFCGTERTFGESLVKNQILSEREVLERAFSSSRDALTVVILGGGPVGLMMANMLSSLLENRVKIVVFETRTLHNRRKKMYSREWLTELPLGLFHRCPMLLEVVANFAREDTTLSSLPINFIETLLLLSNRQNGVQFIYDDYRKYSDLLSPSYVDVVFDATGHRLSPLRYQNIDNIFSQELDRASQEFSAQNIIGIGQDLLFPMNFNKEDNLHSPYSLNFVKINFLTGENYETLQSFEKAFENDGCLSYSCGPYFPFKASIPDSIAEVYSFHPDSIASALLLVSVTDEQATLMDSYFRNESNFTDSSELVLRSIPETLLSEPAMCVRGLSMILSYLKRNSLHRTTITLPYSYNPYMYKPAPVPHSIHLLDESLPVFRIGESLLSGDATASTGLYTQFYLVSRIVRLIGQKIFNTYG